MQTKIGAAYIRVSDERQDEYSPDSQLKKIQECAEKDGYFIPDEYIFYDDGISGRSVKKRNDFNRMIAIAKDKNAPFDQIYVWKFSRFARNQEESLVYKNLLKKRGITVKSVSETIPEGIYGSLIERIIEWMDEFYSINLSTEVTRGMTEKLSRGEPTNNAPFGYDVVNKQYVPNEDARHVVKVFELFVGGKGSREIAQYLASKGVVTIAGNVPDNRFVDYMLNNPVYIGKLRRSKDGKRDVSKRNFDSDNIMIVDGVHQPIISMELWNKTQERIAQRKVQYSKYARKQQPVDFMLKGLVRCSNCGATLTATAISKRSTNRSIQCHNYARGTCTVSHSITLPKIEEAVIEGLEMALEKNVFTIAPSCIKETKNEIDYDKLIDIEYKKLKRARDLYLTEVDTIEQYKQNKTEIEANIQRLIKDRDESKPQEIDTSMLVKKTKNILDFIKSPSASPKAKNEALRTLVNNIIYYKPKNEVAIYFNL